VRFWSRRVWLLSVSLSVFNMSQKVRNGFWGIFQRRSAMIKYAFIHSFISLLQQMAIAVVQLYRMLPFSQHWVLRYTQCPAVPPNFSICGTPKKFSSPKLCTEFPPLLLAWMIDLLSFFVYPVYHDVTYWLISDVVNVKVVVKKNVNNVERLNFPIKTRVVWMRNYLSCRWNTVLSSVHMAGMLSTTVDGSAGVTEWRGWTKAHTSAVVISSRLIVVGHRSSIFAG